MRLPFFKKKKKPEPVAFPVRSPGVRKPAGSQFARKMGDSKKIASRFPNVKTIGINLAVKAPFNDVEPTLRGKSFSPDSLAVFEFHCKNVDCVGGGFDITDSVEQMVKKRVGEFSGRRICRGWASKEYVNQRRCHYELNFRIIIAYDK